MFLHSVVCRSLGSGEIDGEKCAHTKVNHTLSMQLAMRSWSDLLFLTLESAI